MEKLTYNKIVYKAKELFADCGVANVTMSLIAKEAGVGRRTLYMYFSSKDCLYEAVVAYEVGIIYDAIDEVFKDTSDSDSISVIQRYVRARFDALGQLIQKNPSIRNDFINDLPRVNKIRETFDRDESLLLNKLISRELSKVSVGCDSKVNSIAKIVHIMMKGLEVPIIIQNFSNESIKLLDQCIEMITKSIIQK